MRPHQKSSGLMKTIHPSSGVNGETAVEELKWGLRFKLDAGGKVLQGRGGTGFLLFMVVWSDVGRKPVNLRERERAHNTRNLLWRVAFHCMSLCKILWFGPKDQQIFFVLKGEKDKCGTDYLHIHSFWVHHLSRLIPR